MKTFLESLEEVKKDRIVSDYKKFVKDLVKNKSLNFHPDDKFKEYISIETKKKTFTSEEAKKLQEKMDYFFDKLGDKVYDIAHDLLLTKEQKADMKKYK